MNTIRLAGQVISCVNYASTRLFNMNPLPLKKAAEEFLASGITDIEIPVGVLDPEGRFPEKAIDASTLKETIKGLPKETRVIASYFGSGQLGDDYEAFVGDAKRKFDHFADHFPYFMYTMVHPPAPKYADQPDLVKKTVDAWARLAQYAAKKRLGFQVCLHNHYDSACETADQVRSFLEEIKKANVSALRWGPDTGHSHGMGKRYLEMFAEYAPLIGNYFHIKGRNPAFDQLHGKEMYAPDRDIWGNKAEFGKGLYSGFINGADPEVITPFAEIFRIIREKVRPANGPTVYGTMEIDIPRQHPRLEVMCYAMFLKNTHAIVPGNALTYEQIVKNVFAGR
jgi:sugar phosphate isomerase/epimerase